MSRKNRNITATDVDTNVVDVIIETVVEPTTDAPAVETASEELAVEPVIEQPAADAAPVVEVPAAVYGLIATDEDLAKRNIRKGFETVLITELKNGPGTCQQLTDRMLASGEFMRVAPRAAELRPTKPTQFLLTKWVGGKLLAILSPEEVAALAAPVAEELESTDSSNIVSEATDTVSV